MTALNALRATAADALRALADRIDPRTVFVHRYRGLTTFDRRTVR